MLNTNPNSHEHDLHSKMPPGEIASSGAAFTTDPSIFPRTSRKSVSQFCFDDRI